jgi:hypothetical protein
LKLWSSSTNRRRARWRPTTCNPCCFFPNRGHARSSPSVWPSYESGKQLEYGSKNGRGSSGSNAPVERPTRTLRSSETGCRNCVCTRKLIVRGRRRKKRRPSIGSAAVIRVGNRVGAKVGVHRDDVVVYLGNFIWNVSCLDARDVEGVEHKRITVFNEATRKIGVVRRKRVRTRTEEPILISRCPLSRAFGLQMICR